MPFYYGLKRKKKDVRERATTRILALRQALKVIPEKKIRDNLLLATWNLREFGGTKMGPRLPESYYYIAEIISRFDLVAVQEVRRNLKALKEVMNILGPNWDYIATDVTEGTSGNQERVAYVYDRRKVRFRHIAGEIVLPSNRRIRGDIQFARSPFLVAFQARWLKFCLCSVHIYYGADTGAKLARRVAEIRAIAEFMARRAKKEPDNYVLLGDFNIIDPTHETMQALTDSGFVVPTPIQQFTTNIPGTKHYDQIAFMPRANELQLATHNGNESAGTLDFFKTVFRYTDADWSTYQPEIPEDKRDDKKYYKTWRTYQMSDHLPLWVELEVDFSEQYLKSLKS